MTLDGLYKRNHLVQFIVGFFRHCWETWFSMGIFSWHRKGILRIWRSSLLVVILMGYPVHIGDGVYQMSSLLGGSDIWLDMILNY